jgi:hypothetical protein
MSDLNSLLQKFSSTINEFNKKYKYAEPSIPKTYTSKEAKDIYGIDLPDPNYLLKVQPDGTTSWVTPTNYEITNDRIIDPEGRRYTYDEFTAVELAQDNMRYARIADYTQKDIEFRLANNIPEDIPLDEWDAQQQALNLKSSQEYVDWQNNFRIENNVPENISVDDFIKQNQEQSDKINKVFGGVFAPEEVDTMIKYANTDTEDFVTKIRDIGKNDNTVSLLRTMFPKAKDIDIEQVFQPLQEDESFITGTNVRKKDLDFSYIETGVPTYATFREKFYKLTGRDDFAKLDGDALMDPTNQAYRDFLMKNGISTAPDRNKFIAEWFANNGIEYDRSKLTQAFNNAPYGNNQREAEALSQHSLMLQKANEAWDQLEKSTIKVTPEMIETAKQYEKESTDAYQEMFGQGSYFKSGASEALSLVLPATSKLINPESPDIDWTDIAFDVSMVIPMVGYISKAGLLVKNAKLATRLLQASEVVSTTGFTVALGAMTADGWEKMTPAERLGMISMTALAGTGLALSTRAMIKTKFPNKPVLTAVEIPPEFRDNTIAKVGDVIGDGDYKFIVTETDFDGKATEMVRAGDDIISPPIDVPQRPQSFTFVSPNEFEDILPDVAISNLDSPHQALFKDISDEIDTKYGMKTKSHNALGDWSDGAENSILSEGGDIDWETLKHTAELKGYIGNQKSVIPFKVDPNGNSLLYQFELSAKNWHDVRAELDTAGIKSRTIVKTETGYKISIWDYDGSASGNINKIGENHGIDIETYRGKGEYIGTDVRSDSQTLFRRDIEDFQKQHPTQGYDYEARRKEVFRSRDLEARAFAVHEQAVQKQSVLNGIVEEISKPLNLKTYSDTKIPESIASKVRRHPDLTYDVLSIKDHVRSSIVLSSDFKEMPQIIRQLAQGRQIRIEDTTKTPLNRFGYRGITISFRMEDGLSAEIQLHTADSWAVKQKSHPIYERWRNISEKDVSADLWDKYQADMSTSKKMWKDYWDNVEGGSDAISSSLKGLDSEISPQVPLKGTQPLSDKTLGGNAPSTSSNLPSANLDKSISEPPTTSNSNTKVGGVQVPETVFRLINSVLITASRLSSIP